MTPEKHKELNALVKACKLKYSDKDPRAKTYIEEADVYDSDDAFFNHRALRIISYEGQLSLDKSRPIDKIILLGLQPNNQFQEGGEKINPLLSSRVKYVITDKNIDTKIKKELRNDMMEATKLYAALNDDKKVKIAMAMGLISNENVDRALVDEVLWDVCQDSKSMMGGSKITKQKAFINLCKTGGEELRIRHMIQKAKASGNLKRNKTQGWLLFGQPVGSTDGKLYEYFSNPENQEAMMRLEKALEE